MTTRSMTPFSSENAPTVRKLAYRFCLSLAAKSKNSYEELRQSGILRLPSSRTLNDYRNVYCTAPGIQDNVLEELKSESLSLASHERFLVISIDEMKVTLHTC
ncbi:uncharacterized protein LOC143459574 [Clavelina lepadiformis]|uniref:uncharacterized protein LOC143459574 n=1 Tax=Clavelina lepadiformis TaxID=159417 RepID=UPI0040419D90